MNRIEHLTRRIVFTLTLGFSTTARIDTHPFKADLMSLWLLQASNPARFRGVMVNTDLMLAATIK